MRRLAFALVLLAVGCGDNVEHQSTATPAGRKSALIGGGYLPGAGGGVNFAALGGVAGDQLGYDGTVAVAANDAYRWHHGISWCEELDGQGASSITADHVACQTASGACTGGGTSLRPGMYLMSTAASATGTTRTATNLASMSFHGTDAATIEWLGLSTPILDDGTTEKFDEYIGWGDVINADQADGCYFLSHNTTGGGAGGTNSADWQISCSANSVRTRATLDGVTTDTVLRALNAGDDSVVPETGEVDNFKITCTTARCDFYMQRLGTDAAYVRVGSACSSGCSMAATSIPPAVTAASSARTFGGLAEIVKWAGTTARFLNVDGVCYSRPLAVGR